MNTWPYAVSPMTRKEIFEAVNDEQWQQLKMSLKDIPTREKLNRLEVYRMSRHFEHARAVVVRVDNYINALLRGGQLIRRDDGTIEVQR